MRSRELLLVAITVVAIIAAYTLSPAFPQYPSYYNFADARTILGLSNAINVLSNVMFLLVGFAGTTEVFRWSAVDPATPHRPHYAAFFVGMILTALGSAYFHWAPATETLVWDRVPMTILFMSFLCSAISELIHPRPARLLLPVLLIVGMLSAVYWGWSESVQRGDLRYYGLVQYLPFILVLAMLALYRTPPGYAAAIGFLMCTVIAAKLFEHFDHEIYRATGLISGHTLKHLFAGLSGAFLLLWLRERNSAAVSQDQMGTPRPAPA